MILPEAPAGWVALGISLAIWAFIFFSVGLLIWDDIKESKKKNKKSSE